MVYSLMMDGNMTKVSRDKRVNVKLRESLRQEFAAVSWMRDLSMSDIIRQFIIRTVHEAKTAQPEEFKAALAYVLANPQISEKARSKTTNLLMDKEGNTQALQLPVANSGKRGEKKQPA